MAIIKYLFEQERKPRRGLLAAEWVVMGYTLLTLALILFTWTKQPNPAPMLWGRFRAIVSMLALWGVYRMLPCRLTMLCRVLLQVAMLSWWYPDTYALNRIFPNLDHHLATLEHSLFGCQPALLFSEQWTSPVWSELMYMSYSSYFLLVAIVTLSYFMRRYDEFQHMAFILIGSFFLYYIIFVALPVTGPQYYYLAADLENIRQGVFPDVGDYFLTHDEMMIMPGYSDGWFYQFIEQAHATGERPTAAFPSSHIGVTTVLFLLAWRLRIRSLRCLVGTLLVLMCMSTVYIRAHYAIDVIAGLVSGVVLYFGLRSAYPER